MQEESPKIAQYLDTVMKSGGISNQPLSQMKIENANGNRALGPDESC